MVHTLNYHQLWIVKVTQQNQLNILGLLWLVNQCDFSLNLKEGTLCNITLENNKISHEIRKSTFYIPTMFNYVYIYTQSLYKLHMWEPN